MGFLISSFLLLVVITSLISSSLSSYQSVYELLKSHGLPVGLFPKGIEEFKVDEKGRFEVHLARPCNAKFENEVHYDRNISGTVSYGQIGGLSGVSSQELFLWFPVKGIRVDIPSSGLIYFDVGVIYKQFALSLFEFPPECKSDEVSVNSVHEIVFKQKGKKIRYDSEQRKNQRVVL